MAANIFLRKNGKGLYLQASQDSAFWKGPFQKAEGEPRGSGLACGLPVAATQSCSKSLRSSSYPVISGSLYLLLFLPGRALHPCSVFSLLPSGTLSSRKPSQRQTDVHSPVHQQLASLPGVPLSLCLCILLL